MHFYNINKKIYIYFFILILSILFGQIYYVKFIEIKKRETLEIIEKLENKEISIIKVECKLDLVILDHNICEKFIQNSFFKKILAKKKSEGIKITKNYYFLDNEDKSLADIRKDLTNKIDNYKPIFKATSEDIISITKSYVTINQQDKNYLLDKLNSEINYLDKKYIIIDTQRITKEFFKDLELIQNHYDFKNIEKFITADKLNLTFKKNKDFIYQIIDKEQKTKYDSILGLKESKIFKVNNFSTSIATIVVFFFTYFLILFIIDIIKIIKNNFHNYPKDNNLN